MYSFLSKCKNILPAFFQKKIGLFLYAISNFVCINPLELGKFAPKNNAI